MINDESSNIRQRRCFLFFSFLFCSFLFFSACHAGTTHYSMASWVTVKAPPPSLHLRLMHQSKDPMADPLVGGTSHVLSPDLVLLQTRQDKTRQDKTRQTGGTQTCPVVVVACCV